MNFSSGIFTLLAAASFLTPLPAEGQGLSQGIDVVERVVAVVGDSVILLTELDEFLLTMEARGWSRPTGAAELLDARLEVLDQLINQNLVLQEAAKDSLLTIPEEELEERVQEEVDGQIRQFGTLGRLQQALAEQNMTMAVFREQRKDAIRRQLLQERYFAKRGQGPSDIVITEEEARAYFDENQDLIPTRPLTIFFEAARLLPEPTDDAKAEALAEADSVLILLGDGEEFEEFAARYSDGPSASAGGELGWARQDGSFVKEFEEMAFRMPAGAMSRPVETEFGYHIILVERIRGGERRLRHILFQPEIRTGDVELNDDRTLEFAARLQEGETFSDLGLKPDSAHLTLEQIAQTSPGLASAMRNAQVGDVIGPVRMDDPRNPDGWTLVRVLETTVGGLAEFAEFQDVIVERLQSQRLTASVVEGLRSETYIDIRLGGG
jgi:peptidyl-prolyl cis-trans isomerase SurA